MPGEIALFSIRQLQRERDLLFLRPAGCSSFLFLYDSSGKVGVRAQVPYESVLWRTVTVTQKKAEKSTKKTASVQASSKKNSTKTRKNPAKTSNQADSHMPHRTFEMGGVEITVLGTAHVSRQSVEDVIQSIEQKKPDTVCVELCQSRYDAMKDPDRWRNLDIGKVIRQKKIGLLASQLILSSFQKKIGDTMGVRPGEEMMTASRMAEEKKLNLVLADRDVQKTLSRAWGIIGFWSKLWLGSTLMASLLVRDEIEEEEIERLKQEDILSDLFSNLPSRYDRVKSVIIDERDAYLAEKIKRASIDLAAKKKGKGKIRLLAVVGAGHMNGIVAHLTQGKSANLEELETIPPRGIWKTVLYWGLLSAGILAVSRYIGQDGWEAAQNSLIAWVAGRSLGSGIGAVIARAHPLTTLVTMIMAPVSIFIWGSRLWMFTALTEVWLKKPRVEDFENITTDTEDIKHLLSGFYKNRVLKLFWIIGLVSTGLTVGNLVFWYVVLGGQSLTSFF